MISEGTIGALAATKLLMAKPVEDNTLGERLREAREAKGLSQPELALRVQMSQQGIAAIESGGSKRPRKLRELAKALGRSEDWLLGESDAASGLQSEEPPIEPEPNASFPPNYKPFHGKLIPLLGQTSAGANGRFHLNGQEVGLVFCPPVLDGVKGAYAVLVYGDSMEPKFEAGETVWLHPYLPVRRGDYVVAQISGEDDFAEPGSYIKQFVSMSASKLTLRQFNPGEGENEVIEFPSTRVLSVHKIVFHQLP